MSKSLTPIFLELSPLICTHHCIPKLQRDFFSEYCSSSLEGPDSSVLLALRNSREGVVSLGRLAFRSRIFLMPAGCVTALSVRQFRPRPFFNKFGNLQVSHFWLYVLTQFCLSQTPRPIVFHLTLDFSHFDLCLCCFTKLTKISSALFFSSHPLSSTPKLRSFSLSHSFLIHIPLAVSTP